MNSASLLTQLARRAVAAPEVRPRLASRFELAPAAIGERPHQGVPQQPAEPARPGPQVMAWPTPPTLPAAPAPSDKPRPAQSPDPEVPGPSSPASNVAAAPVQPQVQVMVQQPLHLASPAPEEAGPRGADRPRPLPATPVPPLLQGEAARATAGQTTSTAPRVRSESVQPLTITPPPAPAAGVALAAVQRPDAVCNPPATTHLPQAPQRERQPPAPPAIEITIGRIDVRAVHETPPAATRAATPAPATPRALGLADYLRQRPS